MRAVIPCPLSSEPMSWPHPAGGNCSARRSSTDMSVNGITSSRSGIATGRLDSSPSRCLPCIETSPGIVSGSGIVRVVTRQAAPTFT